MQRTETGNVCVGCSEGRRAPGESRQTLTKVRAALTFEVPRPTVAFSSVDDARLRPGVAALAVLGVFLGACLLAGLVADADATAARAVALFVVLSGALVGLVLHEWAHAVVAYRGGDDSVADKGYLTMDVRDYVHPGLSLAVPLACVAVGGLPLPGGAVWVNTEWLRGKWWDSAVSAAGPAMSLTFAVVLFLAAGLVGDDRVLGAALAFLAFIQVGLVILNLLPVPGLDGYGILEPHLRADLQLTFSPVKLWGPFVVLAIALGTPALDVIWDWSLAVSNWLGADLAQLSTGQALTRL